MIPIMPDGEVKILSRIPFDSGYVHTCLFGTEIEQRTYMRLNAKVSLDAVSYTRESGNSIKVQVKVEDLYNCNYMMFKNTSFENKWFYAFITGVEYVNNITSRVYFEIDVLQSWLFDFTLGECFVEREHSATDVAGDNLVPETLETGDYVTDKQTNLPYNLSDWSIVMWTTVNPETGNIVNGGLRNGLPCAALPIIYNFNSLAGAISQLDQAGKGDAIVAICAVPTAILGASDAGTLPTEPVRLGFTIPKSEYCFGSFDGYVPKNKKLYTSPYNTLYVSGFNGNAGSYPFEYFKTPNGAPLDNCPFVLTGDISPGGSIVLYPNEYKGTGLEAGNTANYDEKLLLGTTFLVPWSNNAYQNWLAQNGVSLAVNTIGSILGATSDLAQSGQQLSQGLSLKEMGQRTLATKGYGHGGAAMRSKGASMATSAAGAIAAGVVNVGLNVASALATVYEHSLQPPQSRGNWGNAYLLSYDLVGGWYCRKRIRGEFARIIDGYFDMFGYATNRVKTPNINSRPHWNYVKTRYCMLKGNMPESAEEGIRAIFNNGITFWKNPGEIGDYSLDNSPA